MAHDPDLDLPLDDDPIEELIVPLAPDAPPPPDAEDGGDDGLSDDERAFLSVADPVAPEPEPAGEAESPEPPEHYRLRTDIELPPQAGRAGAGRPQRPRYPFETMDVGHAFTAPLEPREDDTYAMAVRRTRARLANAARTWAKANQVPERKWRTLVHQENEGGESVIAIVRTA